MDITHKSVGTKVSTITRYGTVGSLARQLKKECRTHTELCTSSVHSDFWFILFVLSAERKACGTQGKAEQGLDLLYSRFHGSSSTREKSAALPFLPMVTWKQLPGTSNFGTKAQSYLNCQGLGAEKPICQYFLAIYLLWIWRCKTDDVKN